MVPPVSTVLPAVQPEKMRAVPVWEYRELVIIYSAVPAGIRMTVRVLVSVPRQASLQVPVEEMEMDL